LNGKQFIENHQPWHKAYHEGKYDTNRELGGATKELLKQKEKEDPPPNKTKAKMIQQQNKTPPAIAQKAQNRGQPTPGTAVQKNNK
jgi:hypothetical protein